MTHSSFISLARFGSSLVAVTCLTVAAHAGYATDQSTNDGFVQMRTNAGEQMRTEGGTAYFGSWLPGGDQLATRNGDWFGIADIRRLGEFEFPLELPPLPPALGDELPYARYAGAVVMPAAEFSREIFYGPCATLAARKELSAAQEQRVAAYRANRDQLLREIDAKFDELRAATPAARASALAGFARQQDVPLQALEAEAEAIRSDLAHVEPAYRLNGVYTSTGLSAERSAHQATWTYEAVYQFPNLSIEQRQLLPEIAYSTFTRTDEQQQVPNAQASSLYFSPFTGRIELPSKLSPALESKIEAYVEAKEKLKHDLRTAIIGEFYRFSFHRSDRLAALANDQAPGFAALAKLADEIREGLAGYPSPDEPESAALPTDLAKRVADFQTRKLGVQRELSGQLRHLRTEYPHLQFAIGREGDSLAIEQTGGKPVAGLTEFNASLVSRYGALRRDSESLRRDITAYAEKNLVRPNVDVDQIATEFAKAYAARQTWSGYRDYYRAELQLGLSPAQRRLLFQAAAEQLDQAGWLPRR